MSARSTGANRDDVPFGRETGVPPPRIEALPTSTAALMKPIMITEKRAQRPPPQTVIAQTAFDRPTMPAPPNQGGSSWEDSPKCIGESRGILTPSSPTRKAPSVSDSGGLRQPYIPAPAPKIVPSSVILGPMANPPVPRALPRPPRPTSFPKNLVPSASPQSRFEATKPRLDIPQISPSPVKPSTPEDTATTQEHSEKTQSKSDDKSSDAADGKDSVKSSESSKKKFPSEED